MVNFSRSTSPPSRRARTARSSAWMLSTTSSLFLPDITSVSTKLPASFESGHQSRRTMSRPLVSSTVPTVPSGRGSIFIAAYFFFLRRSIVLKTPSISSSRSLYRLFTSFLMALPMSRTRARSSLFVCTITESVSP